MMSIIPILTPAIVAIITALFGKSMNQTTLYSVALSILSVGFFASWGISTGVISTSEPIVLGWLTLIDLNVNLGVEWFNISAFASSIIYTVVMLIIVYSIRDVSFEDNNHQKISLVCGILFFVQVLFASSYMGQMVFAWLGVVFLAMVLNGLDDKKDNNILVFLVFNFLSILLFIASIEIGNVLSDIETSNELDGIQTIFGVKPSEIIIYLFLVSMAIPMAVPPFNAWIENIANSSAVVMSLVFGLFTVISAYILFHVFSLVDISETGRIVVAGISLVGVILSSVVALNHRDIFKCISYVYSAIGCFIMFGFGVASAEYVLLFALVTFVSVVLLFMIFGAVQYSLSGERDMTKMGGLAKKLPGLYFVFFVAVMAILCIPPFSGFFARTWLFTNIMIENQVVLWVGLILVFGACFALANVFGRIWALVFYGDENEDEQVQARMVGTSKYVMVSLVILSIMVLISGFVAEKVFFNFDQKQNTFDFYGIVESLGVIVVSICGLLYGFKKTVKNQENIDSFYTDNVFKNNFYIYDSINVLLVVPINKITEYVYKLEILGASKILNKYLLMGAEKVSYAFNYIFSRAIVLTVILLFVTFGIIVLLFTMGVK